MKRIALCLILAGALAAACWLPAREITPIEEPLPVEIKPVLVDVAKPWTIRNDTGLHTIAYYQRVTMPDGTTQELKSRTPLTALQWKALAQKQWDVQSAAELNRPIPCMRCGGSGIEP